MTKFPNVPTDEDTKIVRQKETEIDNIPAMIQKWVWDGIVAESVIFHDKDVSSTSDDELFQKIIENYTVGPDRRHTVTRDADGYTFVNFNFEY